MERLKKREDEAFKRSIIEFPSFRHRCYRGKQGGSLQRPQSKTRLRCRD